MKIVIRIVGVIAVLMAVLTCGLGTVRNFNDADAVSKYEKESASLKEKMKGLDANTSKLFDKAVDSTLKDAGIDKLPSKGTFQTVGIALALLVVLSIAAGIFTFLPKPKPSTILVGIIIILSIIALSMSPSFAKTGMFAKASNFNVALYATIPALIAGVCAFFNGKLFGSKTAIA